MIPEPAKRPFTFPLPCEALDFFLHPSSRVFGRAVFHPDGCVHAAGYIALRARRLAGAMPEEYPPAGEEFTRRVGALPWHRMEDHPESLAKKEWRPVDSLRGAIYDGGLLPLWHPGDARKGRLRPEFTRDRLVRMCGAQILPLAVLQLLARLPRAEICMAGAGLYEPVLFRFSGGEVIVPHLGHEGPAEMELFKPRSGSPIGPML